MLDPRPPRPMSPRTYRKNLRKVHASLVAEGPVLITSRAGTVALVMAPPDFAGDPPRYYQDGDAPGQPTGRFLGENEIPG